MNNQNQNLEARGVSLTPAQWERRDRLTDEYGKRCAKSLHFLPFKMGTAEFKSCGEPFFEIIPFFLHSISANLMIAKKRENASPPKS